MTPEEEVIRAGQAREVLENARFKEAFETIESVLLAGIRASAFTDEKLREKLSQRYAALHDVRAALQSVIETGQMAKEQLSLMQRVRDKVFN